MGQGTKTIFPQLVAEELGVRRRRRDRAPGHRGRPGFRADGREPDRDGRRRLLIKAARRLRDEVEARNGGRPFADVYRDDAAAHGPTRIDQRSALSRRPVRRRTYRGDAYPAFGWAACVATVDVDLDTAEVTVRDVVAADDIGKVIHPVLAEGQVEGGTLQAIGYATIEEIKLRDGRYLNDRLATYIIPTALDAPRIETILVEAPFSAAPHGAKGVGELPMDVGAPAVVAAIHDATGVWVHDLPATPERILAAMGATPATSPAGSPGGRPRAAVDDGDRGADRARHGPAARRPDRPPAAPRPATRRRRRPP